MNAQTGKSLDLQSLHDGIPVIPEEAAGFYIQNCMVCLESQGHKTGVLLNVDEPSKSSTAYALVWEGDVSESLRRAYSDLVRAAEYAACAIALLTVREVTDYTAIEQACRGTTIDYYLGYKEDAEKLIFNRAARLEASGILKETASNTVEQRVKEKLARLKVGLSALVVVVEFGQPRCRVVRI